MKRAGSHKLFAAFLNRVVRIWLPAMDADVVAKKMIRKLRPEDGKKLPESELVKLEDDDLLKTEAFQIVRARLEVEPRFREHASAYASLIVLFHAQVKLKVLHKRTTLAAGVDITFRFMLNVLTAAKSLDARRQPPTTSPASALALAVHHVYIGSISDSSQGSTSQAQHEAILKDLMEQVRHLMVDAADLVPKPTQMRAAQPWKQDENVFFKRLAALESALLELLQGARNSLPNDRFVALSYQILDQAAMRQYLELDDAAKYEDAIRYIAAIDTAGIPSKANKRKVLRVLELHSSTVEITGKRLRDVQRQVKHAAEEFIKGASVSDATI